MGQSGQVIEIVTLTNVEQLIIMLSDLIDLLLIKWLNVLIEH